ncbi:MAG: bifunctional folylpolyglutamate synthase/dihydrofolate synthase [Candidatus Cloacimonetes bacterium]|jgi:dihydrofolate synthase/folylpolyglutamate synthase|nr:bifunctional folylpolyglutamate synthase/dihydrofolate synthase [Candidatus Cloacimonadota bacterium]MDY0172491.1 folylpolyglutamate synthase/dihydrofolate synthase family protein [Candidatus Cloacimonadaceae bacterium]
MQYQEFLDHIYQRYSGNVKLELGRMEGLLKDMGSPETKFGGFHVAGTNGKGSVCATLEALCLTHGLKTGLNTSPHLINYTERFRIAGQEVPFATILEQFNKYVELFNKWEASFFEISTAIAFALFAEAGLDLAVIEVGLGGRLDATNLFTPDVTAITTIALDHIKTLGGTVEIIAGEKAGIIKEQISLVIGDIEDSPLAIIKSVAKSKKAPIYLYGEAWQVKIVSDSTAGICFDYQFKDYHYAGLKANLMGEHQAINLGQALTSFILYCEKHGIKPDQDKVRKALAQINWMGRMQVLSLSPTVIIDGAHNVHGVRALIKSLDKVYPDRKFVFVLSILADKDYSEMIHLICSKAEKVYVAQNTSDRAATAEAQKEAVEKHHVQAIVANSVAEAFNSAYQEAGPDSVIVAGGSLFTVGEVISAFRKYV